MKNKKNILLFLVMGCAFLFIFKIVPLLMSLGLSFKDYSPMYGYFGSPWVGFRNFKMIFQMAPSMKIFFNALRLNLVTLLLAVPISGVFVYCANRIRNRNLAFMLTAVFALAAIFPQVIFAGAVTFALGIEINSSYDFVYAFFEALRLSGLVALGAYFMSSGSSYMPGRKNASRLTLTILAVALLAGMSRYLSSDFELAGIIQNPLIYDRAEVIDTYYYKISLMQMKFGMGSALWFIKYISELVIAALAAAGVFLVLKAANKSKFEETETDIDKKSVIPTVICAAMSLAVATICIISLFPNADAASVGVGSLNPVLNITIILMSIIVSCASAALAAVLAYPFVSPKASHKITYAAFLVPSLYGANIVQNYLLYRILGLVNTIFPVLLIGFLPVWMIAAYAIFLNRPSAKELTDGKNYIRCTAPTAFIMAAINFSAMWGSYGPALIYTSDPSMFTAALALRNAMTGGVMSFALNLWIFIPVVLVWAAAAAGAVIMKKDR